MKVCERVLSLNISRHTVPNFQRLLQFYTSADDVVAVADRINQLLTHRSNVQLGNIPRGDIIYVIKILFTG